MKPTISAEVRDNLPAQCQKCPVLTWFDYSISAENKVGTAHVAESLSILDSAESARLSGEEKTADELEFRGKLAGQFALWAADAEKRFVSTIDLLVMSTDESCPGSKRGSVLDDKLLKVIDWIEGNRVCRNPRFKLLQNLDANFDARLSEMWRPEVR